MAKTKILVEICCGSAEDVMQAKLAGAHRVELNSCLFLGGLTPSIGSMIAAKKTGIEIMAMVRPREGGFCYTDAEFETMLLDAEALIKAGADGIVFGILNADGTVDVKRCAELIRVVGFKQSVFHRAIDVVPDWKSALDTLMELGISRVLTSGRAPSAVDGIETIKQMIGYADGRIGILPGAGIRLTNVQDLIEKTGATEVHASLKKTAYDRSAAANPSIHFGGALYPPEDIYSVADKDMIKRFVEAVK